MNPQNGSWVLFTILRNSLGLLYQGLSVLIYLFFFRKKLRGAVYDALVERKINENDPLFRPCFKKLFDICSVFAQNMPKDTNSTKKWLSVVANQNADSVINLEKALRQ